MSLNAHGLQSLIYTTLHAHPALTALIGGEIHDEIPPGTDPQTYVLIGEETLFDRSCKTGEAFEHELSLTVFSREAGYAKPKAVASLIIEALEALKGPMPEASPEASMGVQSAGHLVDLRFLRLRAARAEDPKTRQITLFFRAYIDHSSAA